MRRNVQQIIEGEWVAWARRERWICCDCQLTHEVDYRTRKGQLEVMMKVNRRSTSAFRRATGVRVLSKKK